ncbi:MAG: protein-glutamate O-methyltransferase CheR [Thermodesulfobacteriota bacterium]|nr:protein-glutamate O-methyltransferase CheR [Thermodesulfobacteriota bacterium]
MRVWRLESTVELTEVQYRTLRDIVHEECGINLHEGKHELLKARLAKRMRSVRIGEVSEYLKLIEADKREFVNFIDAVSTNHTYFFRENHHCEFLTKTTDNSEYLKLWSAACSSGEEPYSIAIQLLEGSYRFDILASDISNTMLDVARRGVYHKEKVRLVPKIALREYFQRGQNNWEEFVRVKSNVRKLVAFERHNLVTDASPGEFSVIFCRNVMIYFDDVTKQQVVEKLHGALRKGGLLILGAAEGLVKIKHGFEYVQPSIYRK